jgi:hypothetical protein
VSFVVYTQQEALASDEQLDLAKRRIDSHSRTSIPLFRGSNLGIFVRKRPFALLHDQAMARRRKETRESPSDDANLEEFLFNNEHQQRRFDDYSQNPGPMFGR